MIWGSLKDPPAHTHTHTHTHTQNILLYMDLFRLETLNSALLQNCPFYKLTKLERSNGDDVDDVGGDVDEGMVRQAHISLPPARPH